MKNAIQNALDRAYYRDRYDYRRALVGFARDLNSDLDLERLGERLVRARHRDAASSIAWRCCSRRRRGTDGDVRDHRARRASPASRPALARESDVGARLLLAGTR